jgi:hypothetical protein
VALDEKGRSSFQLLEGFDMGGVAGGETAHEHVGAALRPPDPISLSWAFIETLKLGPANPFVTR